MLEMKPFSLKLGTIAFLIFMTQWGPILAEKNHCSCYTFYTSRNKWAEVNEHCQLNGGNLVSMETEDEWAFINSEIQKRNVGNNEWYIGLIKKQSEWKWISNQTLTIDKWQPKQPSEGGPCVVMAKNWPKGTQGLWDDQRCNLRTTLICEYNKGLPVCNNTALEWCSNETDVITTPTDSSMSTVATTTKTETTTINKGISTTSTSTTSQSNSGQSTTLTYKSSTSIPVGVVNTQQHTQSTHTTQQIVGVVSTQQTTQSTQQTEDVDRPETSQSTKETFPLMVVVISLGVLLVILIFLITVVCFWKRRNKDNKKGKNRLSNEIPNPRIAELGQTTNKKGMENADSTEAIQLFHQNNDESFVTYPVINNNLTQPSNQNEEPTTLTPNEPTYASIEDKKMTKRTSSKKKKPSVAMKTNPTGVAKDNNSGILVGEGGTDKKEVVYASVDKNKKTGEVQCTSADVMVNNTKNETQDAKQWSAGQQVVYASVDKSMKRKAGVKTEDVVYAEVGSKVNKEKQQSSQITYADLAEFNHNAPQAAVKPVPYQPSEYAVIIGQKKQS